MPSVRIQLFGGFRCETEQGIAIAVSAKKARALLSYLSLMQGIPQSRDKLATLFWGNSGDAQARSSLRQALMTIRKCLPPELRDALEADSEFVSLRSDAIPVDVCQFERLVQDDTIENLEQAISLYRGDLLQDMAITAPEFEDWLVAGQWRYRQIALGAMERLIALLSQDGQIERAIVVATNLVGHDPLNEEGHRRLIGLLAGQGKLNEALRQYRTCRDVLRRELDVDPAAETERLHEEILERRRCIPDSPAEDGSGQVERARIGRRAGDRRAAETRTGDESGRLRNGENPDPGEAGASTSKSRMPAAELRHVAVVFADLSNFTVLAGQLWAEEMHELLNRYFEVTDEVITRYGGTIDKHMGDNVMAIFGAPVAHSDDSERAVRAALEIRSRIEALSADVGHELKVHVGIASGQVVASTTGSRLHRAYTVIGESVNLAARLQDLAGPSEIVISDGLYRSVSHMVQGEVLDGLLVQGIPHETRAWRLAGLHQDKDGIEETAFVGRDFELEQFANTARTCAQSGKGRVVYLRGEAGIGKSRLAREFQRIAAQQGYGIHTGALQDFGTERGRGALKNITLSLLDLPWDAELSRIEAVFEQAVVKGWLSRDSLTFLFDILDLQQPSELQTTHESMESPVRVRSKVQLLSGLIERRSLERPLLIMVDDIHWADSRTLSILAGVAATISNSAVLLVMTSRVIEDPLDRTWRSAAQGVALATLDLMPLSNEECLELSRHYSEIDESLSKACIDRSEGNPLYLDQLLRCNGHQSRELPGSIQSIVLSRLDGLSAEDRQALQAASVLGQRFSLATLREIIGKPDYHCANLTDMAFLRAEDADSFAFCHALIHEAIYGAILKSERDQLHLRAARSLKTENVALYAEHLDRANSPETALAMLEAARNSAAKYHFGAALELASRGLERSKDRELSYRLSLLSGFLLRAPGTVARSVDMYESALHYCQEDSEKCKAWTGMAEGLRLLGEYRRALDVLELAEQAALSCDDDRSLARIYSLTGSVYFPMGRFDECLEAHEDAIQAAKRGGSALDEARALSGMGDAYYQRGFFKTAYDYFDQCIALCEREKIQELLCMNLPMRGVIAFYLLDLERTINDCLQAIEIASRVNNYRAEMLAHMAIGPILLFNGNPVSAYEHSDRSLTLARQLGSPVFEAESIMHKTQALARMGPLDNVEDRLLKAYRISSSSQKTYGAAWILSAIAVESKDVSLRKWALNEGEALLLHGCVSHNYLHFYQNAIDATLESGDWDEADRYAGLLESYSRNSEPTPWCAYFVARGRALSDFGRGLRDGDELERLRELCEDATRVGLKSAIPKLEAALAEAEPMPDAVVS
jgi:class 3 adenylate cyclase/predicted ATPase